MDLTENKVCLACGYDELTPVLDLNDQPLPILIKRVKMNLKHLIR
jgi:hypothetical protein